MYMTYDKNALQEETRSIVMHEYTAHKDAQEQIEIMIKAQELLDAGKIQEYNELIWMSLPKQLDVKMFNGIY